MTVLRVFENASPLVVEGLYPIKDFPRYEMSQKCKDDLKTIDDNIRQAHRLAKDIWLD